MESRSFLNQRLHLDLPLLLGVLTLSALGLVALYSAGGRDADLVVRQAIRLAFGFGAMFALAQLAPRRFLHWAPLLYLAGVLLLCLVLVFGETAQGAQRWLRIGPVNFQPSELVKLTVPLMVAWFVSEGELPPRLWRTVLAAFLTVLPVVLIMQQPDLGTALLVAVSGVAVLFLSGVGWRLIAALVGLAAVSAPVLWHFVMHDYQRQRVLTLLDPQRDPLGAGYHIIQSTIAIGSGGMYGKGWFNGTQSQLDFLPERSTDFIFAVISEEFGLLGVVVLLSTYLFVVYRGLYIAAHAQSMFGKLVAGALVLTFFIYAFVNIGMVSGILPVVGLPLPLVSYGGTSMVTLMAGFGIVMSIHTHRLLLSR